MRKIVWLMFFVFLLNIAIAIPPIAQEYYGVVLFSGSPAPLLTEIQVYYDNGGNESLCGKFSIVEPGKYGLMSCNGDDPMTLDLKEGALEGDVPTFKITTFNGSVPNGTNWTGNYSDLLFTPITLNATAYGNTTWNSGEFHQVNLYADFEMWWLIEKNETTNITNVTLPVGFCGDGVCGSGEDCSACSLDCGVCPPPPPGKGGGGGTITGDRQKRDSTGSSPPKAGAQPPQLCLEAWVCNEFTKCQPEGMKYRSCKDTANCGTEISKPRENETCCYEKWECADWSECSPLGEQDRSCVDANGCGTSENTPNTTRTCKYPTCNDGLKNGNEEGIDCGGICSPCKGIEYSKPITAQPTGIAVCGDGICNLNEACGCPQDCRRFPWFIIAIAVAAAAIEHYFGRRAWKRIREDIYLRRSERLRRIAKIKRRSFWFKTIIIIASIVLSVYIFYFATCPGSFRRYLALLIAGAVATPLIAYFILKRFEYSEEEKEMRYELLLETHKAQLEKLIEMENEEIDKLEKEIAKRIGELSIAGLDTDMKLALSSIAYKLDMLAKFLDKKEDYVDVEAQIVAEIEKLREGEAYKKLVEKEENLRYIDSRLAILVSHHKDKEELLRNIRRDDESIAKEEGRVEVEPSVKTRIEAAKEELSSGKPAEPKTAPAQPLSEKEGLKIEVKEAPKEGQK